MPQFHLHTFSWVGGLYGLYWEGDPRGHMFSFSISAPRTSLRRILSFLGCSCALSAFLSSPSSQMKFSRHSFLPALDLETGKLNSFHSCSLPQRNWVCWSDKAFDNHKIHPRPVTIPTSGTELYSLAPPRLQGKNHSSLSTKQAGTGWRRYRDLSWEWGSLKLLVHL